MIASWRLYVDIDYVCTFGEIMHIPLKKGHVLLIALFRLM